MKNKKKISYFSIRLRLFVVLFVFIVAAIILVEGILYYSFKRNAVENRKEKITSQCMVLANQIVESGVIYTGLSDRVLQSASQLANDYAGRALIIDNMGAVVYDTAGVDDGLYMLDARVLKALDGKSDTEYNAGASNYVACMPLTTNSSGTVIGAMVFFSSAADIEAMMSKLNYTIVGINLVALIVVLLVVMAAYAYIGKPFKKMEKSIQDFSTSDNKSITDMRYKETKEIVSTFNVLMDHMNQQDELRRQFVSNVSHELKTPITSMRVLADSLLSMPDAPKELYQEFMQDISSEIDRESKIITDLLELVRMDNAAVKLNVSMININEWLQNILHRLVPIANKQNVEVVMESFREVSAQVDPSKLSLAISNLVENAIKYNRETGFVHVSLNADHKYFYIKVEDNGVGIPEDALDKIFDRFYRVDKARSRDAGGTGLGLAITKSVIQMHRGTIKVFSKVDDGTTFSVRIPLQYKE